MTLKACPQCGYRYNAPENQTCGKCKGWLGAAGGTATAAIAQPRRSLAPRTLQEFAVYWPSPIGPLPAWPNPSGAPSGWRLGALLSRAFGLEMGRFPRGLLGG